MRKPVPRKTSRSAVGFLRSSLRSSFALCLGLGCLLAAPLAHADDDCPCAPPKPKTPWTASTSFGFNSAQGNASTYLITLGPRATYESGDHILNMSMDFRYGENKGQKNVSDVRGSVGYKYLFADRVYGLIGEDAVRDEIATIDYRSITYPALGYFLVKDDTMKLSVDLGPSGIFQRLKGFEDDFFFAYRAGQAFEWLPEPEDKKTKVWEQLSYVQSTQDHEEYIFNVKAGVTAKLFGNLSISQSIEDSFINKPALGKLKNDVIILTALIFNF